MTFQKTIYAIHKMRSNHNISTTTKYPFMSPFSTLMLISKLMERKALKIPLHHQRAPIHPIRRQHARLPFCSPCSKPHSKLPQRKTTRNCGKFHEFTDRCARQYKSKHTFGDLSCCLAVIIVCQLFQPHELEGRNFRSAGNPPLNVNKMQTVKALVFRFCLEAPSQREDVDVRCTQQIFKIQKQC